MMIKSAPGVAALVLSLAAGAAPCFAQSLVNPVGSDSGGNTAMGTGVLVSLGTPNGATPASVYNTGAGEAALNATTTGYGNSAFGNNALMLNTTGYDNTATGAAALGSNLTGAANTATGYGALSSNTAGSKNTATGLQALGTNNTGTSNTANGYQALFMNTTGSGNTATGEWALLNNTTGTNNLASGYEALLSNTVGYSNNAAGAGALYSNTSGDFNNAVGYNAMYANTTGSNNNAQGSSALAASTIGFGNSAVGANSFISLVDGCRNVGIGNNTGTALVNAGLTAAPYDCYDTYIGWGVAGTEGDSGVTRIGNTTYATATYIAGIYGVSVAGSYVCVSSSGQLSSGSTCSAPSSSRYKEDIRPIAGTDGLLKLEPVSYRYRKAEASGSQPLEYGLIAEEVARVYPELVAYDEHGQPDGIKYQNLTPLLLKAYQGQQAQIVAQAAELKELQSVRGRLATAEQHLADQASELNGLRQQLAELAVQTRQLLAEQHGAVTQAAMVVER